MIGGTGTITLKQDTVLRIFDLSLFLENFWRGTFNETFHPNMKDLLTLMFCQTCVNFFLLWNPKGDMGQSISSGFFPYIESM